MSDINRNSGSSFSPTQKPEAFKGSAKPGDAKSVSELGSQASDLASDTKSTVSKIASGVADNLRDGVENQKNAGADVVASLARSARDAADSMESTSPQVANLVRSSANAVEKASKDFREQSLGDIMDSAGEFAAKQPVAFFGCGILAGLLISRLLTSSNR
jgi:ElaB/YqjD/DUF883 family membrane-anchored ribosome-binding protein